jgi:hypothetical protein
VSESGTDTDTDTLTDGDTKKGGTVKVH